VAEATSPINSQGGVTSSSPDEVENGVSTVHVENRSKDGEAAAADTAGPESPAVIDAEHHESKFELTEVFLLFHGMSLAHMEPTTQKIKWKEADSI